MSILIDQQTRLCVAGITGHEGRFHAMNNRSYGTQVVSGETPGKGGLQVDGVPVFNTFHEAVSQTEANAAMIFVPARFAADSILEAADAGIELIVAVIEGIPARDELRVVTQLRRKPGVRLIGPGDPVPGSSFIDVLGLFEDDPQTELVVMAGEIGGDAEERAADFIAAHVSKPVLAYIAGFTAPLGKTMGHAGAIVSGSSGSAQAKAQALEDRGVRVGRTPTEVAQLAAEMLAA